MSLTSLRDYLEDERIAAVHARVELHEDESQHFYVNDEGQLIISVVTHAHGCPIHAALSGGFGGGNGAWSIPAIGTEVLVVFDNGDFEGEAFAFPMGRAPTGLQAGKYYIIADIVEVRSQGGTAQPLATKSDLQDVVDALHEHDHVYIPGTGTPTVTTSNPAVPSPAGTTVLLGE